MAAAGPWRRCGATVAGAIAGSMLPLFVGMSSPLPASEAAPAAADRGFTESIAPLLEARCLGCHSGDAEISGGLRLDLRLGWAQGGGFRSGNRAR